MKHFLPFFLCALLFSSCKIKGSFKGLYSYYDKTRAASPGLLQKADPGSICNLQPGDKPQVFVTSGKALKQCIETLDNAIVYIWAPRCKSRFCYPLNIIQEQCNNRNADLFIVAEYYDEELMDTRYKIRRPIFGIDVEHYNTNLTTKYLAMFLQDINVAERSENRFLRFKKGVFTGSFNDLEKL